MQKFPHCGAKDGHFSFFLCSCKLCLIKPNPNIFNNMGEVNLSKLSDAPIIISPIMIVFNLKIAVLFSSQNQNSNK